MYIVQSKLLASQMMELEQALVGSAVHRHTFSLQICWLIELFYDFVLSEKKMFLLIFFGAYKRTAKTNDPTDLLLDNCIAFLSSYVFC